MNRKLAQQLQDNLPEAVKQCRFCCWRRTTRNGCVTKVPYDPKTGRWAKTDHPETFGSFDDAMAAMEKGKYSGIGILVGNGVAAIDIDDCIDEDGSINALATSVLEILKGCYFEVSPSGTGLRGFFSVPEGYQYDAQKYYIKHGKLEIYLPGMTNRFVTVTGDTYRPGTVADESENLPELLEEHMKRKAVTRELPADFEPHSYLTDEEVIFKARRDRKFADCFDGEWQGYYPSQSEADLFVLGLLAFYCGGDAEQIERLFYESALNREKFANDYGLTAYGERTMKMAIAGRDSFYDPDHGRVTAREDFTDIDPLDNVETGSDADTEISADADTDDLDAELEALLSSSPTISDLYDRHNLTLAAYAKMERPVDYENLRTLARKTGMSLKLYDREIKSREEEVRKKRKERELARQIKAAEDALGKPIPDFFYFDIGQRKLRVDPAKLAIHVKKNLHYILVQDSLRDTRTKYVYEDGVYKICSDERFRGFIMSFIEEYDPALVRMSDVDEVYRNISAGLTAIPFDQLNSDEDIINFKNGLLRLSTMTLEPHSPEVLSTIQLNCEWTGKDVHTPAFNEYLSTLTDGNTDIQRLILQFIGAALSNVRGYRYKKALFLCGEGDTGKSQLKSLTERLLGRDNYAAIDLPDLETQFGASMIYGKRLAGTADMTFMTIRELKMFKTVTGGDNIKIEFKGRTGFSYVYNGLLLFCMNKPPRFGGDNGSWVYNRIMLVNCPNVIPLSQQDHELLDKMWQERDGIVNKAITALRETITAGYRFKEPEEITNARTAYQEENNSALRFFRDCMETRNKPGSIQKDDNDTVTMVHRIYMKWCKYNNNGYAMTLDEFKNAYADYAGLPIDMAIGRRGKGMYFLFHEVTEEAYSNLLPTDTDVHRDFVMGRVG